MTGNGPPVETANFGFLAQHGMQLMRLGALAERYFGDDPNTALIKIRQFGEVLAQFTAAKAGQFSNPEEPQADLLRRLKFERVVPAEVADFFHQVRIVGKPRNDATSNPPPRVEQRANREPLPEKSFRLIWQCTITSCGGCGTTRVRSGRRGAAL
jgi:hypothetical protein